MTKQAIPAFSIISSWSCTTQCAYFHKYSIGVYHTFYKVYHTVPQGVVQVGVPHFFAVFENWEGGTLFVVEPYFRVCSPL